MTIKKRVRNALLIGVTTEFILTLLLCLVTAVGTRTGSRMGSNADGVADAWLRTSSALRTGRMD